MRPDRSAPRWLSRRGLRWLVRYSFPKYAAPHRLQVNPLITQDVVWDLASKTKTTFQLPTDVTIAWHLGITENYVWAIGGPYSGGDTKWLMRFKVE